jgi:predicted porin
MLYAQGANGRVEAGTYDGAVANFTIDASSIAVATGGIGGDYSSWYTYGAVSKNDDPEEGNLNVKTILNGMFLTSTGLPVDNLENSNDNANKITYYSPEMNGFQMGISYIPDSAINGTTSDITGFNQMGFKDVFEGGIMYKMNNNNFNFQMSLTGEVGNARAGIIQYSKDPEARGGGAISDGDESSNVKSIIPINDLNAWQIGMQAEMGGFSFAASYSDWLNSGTATPSQATVINDPKSYSWSVGGAYQYDKVGFSVSYLKSEAQGLFTSSGWSQINNSSTTANAYVQSTNKFSAVSFGLEYDVQPNIAPYAEVTTFEYKTPLSNNNSGLPVNANKGTVFLTGLKLSF